LGQDNHYHLVIFISWLLLSNGSFYSLVIITQWGMFLGDNGRGFDMARFLQSIPLYIMNFWCFYKFVYGTKSWFIGSIFYTG